MPTSTNAPGASPSSSAADCVSTACSRVPRAVRSRTAQVYAADEAFVTGTLGGVTPVVRVDGRTIGGGLPGPLTQRAAALYAAAVGLPA